MALKADKQRVIAWLIEQFPNAFFQKSHLIRPLKLGILEDIIDVYERIDSPPFSKKLLREALNYYTMSRGYLSAQQPDTERVDLYGQPSGLVNSEQAEYAKKRYQERYAAERATIK